MIENDLSCSENEFPSEFKAVLEIFCADEELRTKTLPHVNFDSHEINWYEIGRNHFGSGHSAAIAWAKAIWTDCLPEHIDLFERAFSMDHRIRQAVLKALGIRWALTPKVKTGG